MKAELEIRQEVWLKAYLAYMNRDFGIPNSLDAEVWANDALKAFDKKFYNKLS